VLVLLAFLSETRAESPFQGDNWEPYQLHLALAGRDAAGNSNGMSVMWNTKLQTETSVVKYGTLSGQLSKIAEGSSSAYYITYNHVVTLKDLKPDTVYYYSAGSKNLVGTKDKWSKERSFRTAPLSENLRTNWAFSFFADLGVVNGQATTDFVQTMLAPSPQADQAESVRLVWHAGDAGYADDAFTHFGCYLHFCYEEVLDDFMQKSSDSWSAQVPYMLTPGNHEADCHDPACLAVKRRKDHMSNFTVYNERFHMPSVESNGTLNMHYSFNYGNVHFIGIDTETGFPGAPLETKYVLPCGGFADQMAWIEKDLIAANTPEARAAQPWILVAGHRPMYDQDTVNVAFQAAMEDLFYKYGVDMYFAGHRHYYSRNYPVYNSVVDPAGYVNPKATTYITAGGSGNDEMKNPQRKLTGGLLAKAKGFLAKAENILEEKLTGAEQPKDLAPADDSMLKSHADNAGAWTAVSDNNFVGLTKVTIIDDSALRVDYIHTSTGEVVDTVTLQRDHSPGKYPQA